MEKLTTVQPTYVVQCQQASDGSWRPVYMSLSRMQCESYISNRRAKGLRARYRVVRA